ncbi:hypothetical protein CERZMDRAFT_93096 [Cercospora zeae-maydis SCOH1-5]|uniref:Uncharacterized protein n=1 Tax=Cercospora zeae-maydis SCOH1-5 TaxID=717836 RepID=A0A6A6FU59_9PEZI|nr:hypothetical protein CERZMDRAFT_93096 [Cercospora zeae-maydis SCOH1-5]
MARRGDHAGFLARIARKQKEDGEYWHPLQESSEEELSEEEKSSSSSSSSESEEEDHPALPRTRQTARRGDHVGFLARMARKSENMSEHSMPSIDEDGDRPGPWPKQTARRGDHAGFLARMASRNRQSSDRANSPKQEEENHRHPRAKQTARRGGLRARLSTRPVPSRVTKSIKQTEWDITGDWDIECEELANYIHGAPKRLSMEVYHDTYRPGFHMATFNFNIIVGIMRITCPTPKNTDQKLKGTYAYRGRETGEGEIQLLSDEASYRIVFKDRGSTMEGKFSGTGVGRVKFTGSKVSKGSHRRAASECEWECYSPDAWERARKGRWGRWAGW